MIILLLISFAYATNINIIDKNISYKYADLALKKCGDGNNNWTIHGWWPEYNKHSYPQWCNKTRYREFNKDAIKPIYVALTQLWSVCPNWNGTSDMQFWNHEWEKHGTCTDESVLEFFTHTIKTYLEAEYFKWYNCCESQKTECLIPFSKNDTEIKWLGWCN